MKLSEMLGLVPILKPGTDYQAGVDGDSINLMLYGHVTFGLLFGSLTGDAVLKVYSGAADGTKTTSEDFQYRLADAAQGSAGADTFGARTDVDGDTGLTLTAATYANKLMLIELDARALTEGQPYVTLNFSAAADALNVAVLAILGMPRFAGNEMPTVLPTA